MRPEDAQTKILSSVHAPGPVRVLGPLSNSREHSRTTSPPVGWGSSVFSVPTLPCSIWYMCFITYEDLFYSLSLFFPILKLSSPSRCLFSSLFSIYISICSLQTSVLHHLVVFSVLQLFNMFSPFPCYALNLSAGVDL